MANPIATEGLRLSDVVKYEEGGQNYYSREVFAAEGGALAVGDIVEPGTDPLTQVKLVAVAGNATGVCIKAAAEDAETIVIARDAIVGATVLNYNSLTVADVDAALKALGILVREQQPTSADSLTGSKI